MRAKEGEGGRSDEGGKRMREMEQFELNQKSSRSHRQTMSTFFSRGRQENIQEEKGKKISRIKGVPFSDCFHTLLI